MGGQRGRRIEESKKEIVTTLISAAKNQGCKIKTACDDLSIDFKTYHRWLNNTVDGRKGPLSEPKNKLSNEIKKEMLSIATSKEFCDDSPWVIVAKLADQGRYIASESSFYKTLKAEKLLTHRGKSKPKSMKRPEALMAMSPNEIWSWDITYLKSQVRGQYFYLYMFMDIFSRKIVGFDVFNEESMEHSSSLVSKICLKENVLRDQLVLHADNGGPMKGATMLATLQKLGVTPSFSRPRVSDDNPFSESLFKTAKYNPYYPGDFASIDDARKWAVKFAHWYNNEHYHSGVKFVTPSQRHDGLDKEILMKRKSVYLAAKEKYPERWGNKNVRNWDYIDRVYLNHLQKDKCGVTKMAS